MICIFHVLIINIIEQIIYKFNIFLKLYILQIILIFFCFFFSENVYCKLFFHLTFLTFTSIPIVIDVSITKNDNLGNDDNF